LDTSPLVLTLPDDFEGNALPQLTEQVRVHLKSTEDSLK
jgi:hypothetical protein